MERLEYKYDFQNYYHIPKNGTIKIITQKEYIEKTGESAYLINKLKNSDYPAQINDYFFLKPPFDIGTPYMVSRVELLNITKYFKNLGYRYVMPNKNFKRNIFELQFRDNKVNNFFIKEFGKEMIKEFNDKKKGEVYDQLSDKIIILNNTKDLYSRVFFTPKVKEIMYKKLGLPLEKKIILTPNNYISIDWSLVNLVKYFWKINLVTQGLNQPSPNSHGFIGFKRETSDGIKTVDVLEEIFGKEKTIRLINNKPPGIESAKEFTRFSKKYPDKIRIFDERIITFDAEIIPWMHEKLGLELPDHSKAHRGRRLLR